MARFRRKRVPKGLLEGFRPESNRILSHLFINEEK